MADNLLQQGFVGMCPHGGSIQAVQSSAHVRLNQQPALRFSDLCQVAGCTFVVSGKPQPCVKVQWLSGAQRVRIEGQPALLSSNLGLCQSVEQITQGSPSVVSSQTNVRGQ